MAKVIEVEAEPRPVVRAVVAYESQSRAGSPGPERRLVLTAVEGAPDRACEITVTAADGAVCRFRDPDGVAYPAQIRVNKPWAEAMILALRTFYGLA